MNKLQERRIFLATDGSIHSAAPASLMSGSCIVWGQARKMHSVILNHLHYFDELSLSDAYGGDPRAAARLKSCSGKSSGTWLTAFPSSWWVSIGDDCFIMALRFRCGIRVYQLEINACIVK